MTSRPAKGSDGPPAVTRRSVQRAAVWGAPVVAFSGTAPAYAESRDVPGSFSATPRIQKDQMIMGLVELWIDNGVVTLPSNLTQSSRVAVRISIRYARPSPDDEMLGPGQPVAGWELVREVSVPHVTWRTQGVYAPGANVGLSGYIGTPWEDYKAGFFVFDFEAGGQTWRSEFGFPGNR